MLLHRYLPGIYKGMRVSDDRDARRPPKQAAPTMLPCRFDGRSNRNIVNGEISATLFFRDLVVTCTDLLLAVKDRLQRMEADEWREQARGTTWNHAITSS